MAVGILVSWQNFVFCFVFFIQKSNNNFCLILECVSPVADPKFPTRATTGLRLFWHDVVGSIHYCNSYVATMVGHTHSLTSLTFRSMLPDVIDAFQLQCHMRMEPVFYSLIVFFNKFAVGISLAISAVILE